MNFTSEPFLEPEPPTPAHHRRRRRFFPSLTDAHRSELVENLAKRVSPNFDFFLFAILSGAITAVAFLFNSYSLLILAALLAPIMAPIIGLSLAGAIGSVRFFFLSLAGVIVACLLVIIIGALAGVASLIWSDVNAVQKDQFLNCHLGCLDYPASWGCSHIFIAGEKRTKTGSAFSCYRLCDILNGRWNRL